MIDEIQKRLLKEVADLDSLPDPDVLAGEIIDNLETAMESFKEIMAELKGSVWFRLYTNSVVEPLWKSMLFRFKAVLAFPLPEPVASTRRMPEEPTATFL